MHAIFGNTKTQSLWLTVTHEKNVGAKYSLSVYPESFPYPVFESALQFKEGFKESAKTYTFYENAFKRAIPKTLNDYDDACRRDPHNVLAFEVYNHHYWRIEKFYDALESSKKPEDRALAFLNTLENVGVSSLEEVLHRVKRSERTQR